MLAVQSAFEVFVSRILAGDTGVFFSDARVDHPSTFYMGLGAYDVVSFEAPDYPKYSVFDWKGETAYHYKFRENYDHTDALSASSLDIGSIMSANIDEKLIWSVDPELAIDWQKKIESAIALQQKGEAWVLNLAHDFVAGSYVDLEAMKKTMCQLFWRFLQIETAHCACFVVTSEQIFCSFSPELFIRQEKDCLITSPIKGTGTIEYLNNSKKEESELDMVTDLLRNDLGQVCSTVVVRERRFLRPEKNFYSARSLIEGTLTGTLPKAYSKLLPAGSISGAPKRRVVEIIESLENFERGFYTGTMGVQLSPDSSIWNILIRTLFINPRDNTWSFPIGVGITAESNPTEEWQETLKKVSLLTDLQS